MKYSPTLKAVFTQTRVWVRVPIYRFQ